MRMFRSLRKRRGFATIVWCCTSIFLICVLMDRRSEHNLKPYRYFYGHFIPVHFVEQHKTSLSKCDTETVITSSKLDSRNPWKSDAQCSRHVISHMIPYCRKPVALASFPGSGNTWLRYLIEGASGVFTGSRYKDLQIQMYGLWGEIRSWEDGTTIVQKTHDANKHHIVKDFEGRGILILRNPYDAILSTHNYMYAGHHGRAPARNYARADWHQFVAVQTSKWLDMASNWTIHSSPDKVLVVHYEDVKRDVLGEMRRILSFFRFPIDEDRLKCLEKHKNGLFKREQSKMPEVVPYSKEIRGALDNVIDHVNNNILVKRGYQPMPLDAYSFYKKTDDEILSDIRKKNQKVSKAMKDQKNEIQPQGSDKFDRTHGTKMVLEQYIKWLDMEDEHLDAGAESAAGDDAKSKIMKSLFKSFRQNSNAKTLTGLSEKAETFLTKAVELWPILQRPFARDPIEDAVETDGFRAKKIADLDLPV